MPSSFRHKVNPNHSTVKIMTHLLTIIIQLLTVFGHRYHPLKGMFLVMRSPFFKIKFILQSFLNYQSFVRGFSSRSWGTLDAGLYTADRWLRRWMPAGCKQGYDPIFRRGPDDIKRCAGMRCRLCKFLKTFSVGKSCHLRQPPSNLDTFEKMCSLLWLVTHFNDKHSTAKNFYHYHNVCITTTSSMLNSGCSAASAQHMCCPPSHSFISTV